LTITTKTQCNIGKNAPEHYDGDYLGYYQDNINISLSCVETNGAQLSFPSLIVEKAEKIVICYSSTHTKSNAKESIAQGNVQLQVNGAAFNLQFNGRRLKLDHHNRRF
jgi:hypothetical protein